MVTRSRRVSKIKLTPPRRCPHLIPKTTMEMQITAVGSVNHQYRVAMSLLEESLRPISTPAKEPMFDQWRVRYDSEVMSNK